MRTPEIRPSSPKFYKESGYQISLNRMMTNALPTWRKLRRAGGAIIVSDLSDVEGILGRRNRRDSRCGDLQAHGPPFRRIGALQTLLSNLQAADGRHYRCTLQPSFRCQRRYRSPKKKKAAPKSGFILLSLIILEAEPTGLEPATSDVTGRRSNQLNYDSARSNSHDS
jgi:hypothetical protein